MRVAVLGLGQRGTLYADIIRDKHSDCEIVAVCDTETYRLTKAKELYGVSDDMLFSNEQDFFEQGKIADVLLICTMDRAHYTQTVKAMELGYDVLLEKPMSPNEEECRDMISVAEKCGRKLAICHVLRYTPYYSEIKKRIVKGEIGQIVTISQTENVGYWHQAHSFVRGNFRNTQEASPMILQKCCHDLDIIRWLMDKSCRAVSSFGSLTYYTKENAPVGAAERCLDCTADCIYNAPKWYKSEQGKSWYVGTRLGIEDVDEGMRVLPHGRCVFQCDNDVVDHQVVNMLFEGGATAQLTMTAFSERNYRYIHIHGTAGEIVGDMEAGYFDVITFGKGTERVDITGLGIDLSGHGGGDIKLVRDFLDYVKGNGDVLSSARASLESHLMAFTAEKSRKSGGQVFNVLL